MPVAEPLIDRSLLERLEGLALRWRRSFHGLVGGQNASRFPGAGQQFLDHRNFYPGDDLRAINWPAYLRFERFFLKTFEMEPRVPVRIMLDVSASMGVPRAPAQQNKFDYARRLALALVYIGLVKLDSISVQPFASHLLKPIAAMAGRHCFNQVELPVRNLRPAGQTSYTTIVREFLNANRQPGFVIVISDFLDDLESIAALQFMADFHHEFLLVQLWTKEEEDPAVSTASVLVDAETSETRPVTLDSDSIQHYKHKFAAHRAAVEQIAARNRGRYAGLCTGVSVEDAVFGPVARLIGAV